MSIPTFQRKTLEFTGFCVSIIEEINSEEIHGLANTNARIRRWYKGKSGLYVDNREDGGFLALVNILVEDIYVQSSGGG